MSNGFEVHLISSPGVDLNYIKMKQPEIIIHTINIYRAPAPLNDAISLLKIIMVMLRISPNIVHTHTPKASLLGMMAAYLVCVRIRIFHVHGFVINKKTGILNSLLRLTDKLSIKLSTNVLCVSKDLRLDLIRNNVVKAEKIVVVCNGSINGVDVAVRFNPLLFNSINNDNSRKAIGIHSNNIIIGFVGRKVKAKGLEDLIKCWKIIDDKYPNIRLLLVGPAEGYDSIASSTIDYIEENDNIISLDLQWDIAKYYAIMDIFILPSYREGLPVTVLEASAMEIPVIATNISGCKEIILNKQSGLLITPGNIKEMVGSIDLLINNPQLRKEYGTLGRARMRKYYNQKQIWQETLEYYNLLIY